MAVISWDEGGASTESGAFATAADAAAAADACAAWGAEGLHSLEGLAGEAGIGREPKPRAMAWTDGRVADARGADVDGGIVPRDRVLRESWDDVDR
jgi:hypothetical protein